MLKPISQVSPHVIAKGEELYAQAHDDPVKLAVATDHYHYPAYRELVLYHINQHDFTKPENQQPVHHLSRALEYCENMKTIFFTPGFCFAAEVYGELARLIPHEATDYLDKRLKAFTDAKDAYQNKNSQITMANWGVIPLETILEALDKTADSLKSLSRSPCE